MSLLVSAREIALLGHADWLNSELQTVNGFCTASYSLF